MTLREKIARLLSPKFFLNLGIFIVANHLAWMIRFGLNIPPDRVDVMRRTIPIPSVPPSVVRHLVEHCREVSATFPPGLPPPLFWTETMRSTTPAH